jgi:hypothetical protein
MILILIDVIAYSAFVCASVLLWHGDRCAGSFVISLSCLCFCARGAIALTNSELYARLIAYKYFLLAVALIVLRMVNNQYFY